MKYQILKPIFYRGPGPLNRVTIKPGDEVAKTGIEFPHLSPGEVALLEKKRVIKKYVPMAEPKAATKGK